jgi:hypothetical protein
MNYDYAVSIVDSEGWEAFVEIVKKMDTQDREIYKVSTAWYDNDKYTCKGYGVYGDILIDWEHKYKNVG